MQHLEDLFGGQIRLAPDNLGCITRDVSGGGHGEVAERPIAGALKAPEGKLSGGSNPSLAACVAWDLGGSLGVAQVTVPSLAACVAWDLGGSLGVAQVTVPSLAACVAWDLGGSLGVAQVTVPSLATCCVLGR